MTITDHARTVLSTAVFHARELGLRDREALLLTGSPVLPFTVESDDIDLLLITPYADRIERFAVLRHSERLSEQLANGYVMSYSAHGQSEVDLEVWPAEAVAACAARLGTGIHEIDAVEADFTRVGGLDLRVGTDLLHALRMGVVVGGDAATDRLRGLVPWRTYQAFQRDRNLVNVRDARKGIAASLRAGRPDEAHLKLGWAADSLVDALIFHHGLSISRWKWRLRYLPLLPSWVEPWYRAVRLAGQPSEEHFAEHLSLLSSTLESHLGTEPVNSVPIIGLAAAPEGR